MSQQTKHHGGIMDTLKWAVVFILIAIGVAGNYHYSEQSILIRSIALIAVSVIALFIAYKTSKGNRFWQFVMEARTELRKVVWPSRQETVQTALIVLAITSIVGLILWGVDAMLLKVVAWITGYGAV